MADGSDGEPAATPVGEFEARPAGRRGVFCNRTLNLRGVRAIGYDMDYTLIHYDVDEWERSAFEHARDGLEARGWPVTDLAFDPAAFTLGLTFDLELGNLVKASRFGYVVRAQHGRDMLSFELQRASYHGVVVDLADERFEFMNTLFELSRASLWTQLVARHDASPLPGVASYAHLYRLIDAALQVAHWEGTMKARILEDPQRYVAADPDIVPTLLDQRMAGKELLLITNSDWHYTQRMMSWCFDRHVPNGTTWRDLFDLVIVSAAKPRFFAEQGPIFRVADEQQSLLAPHHGPLERGTVYHGGNAGMVEAALGHDPAQFLYVGDHLFGDVLVTKDLLRWRTALIAREIEAEIDAAMTFATAEQQLREMMDEKIALEHQQASLRMERRRRVVAGENRDGVESELETVGRAAETLDAHIVPLARASSEQGNAVWGPLMRSGADKSIFARQVERYADVYTSRVSNFRAYTPYAYLRAARGSLPHDQTDPPPRVEG